jgi:hypothetical protein
MLPKQLRICGYTYDVILYDEKQTCNDSLGSHWGRHNKININENQCEEMRESTLLHEALEAINGNLMLNLKHDVICRLEVALHQLFQDNPLWIRPNRTRGG